MNKSKIYQVSDEEFKNIVKNSLSYSDCLRTLGLTTKGGSSTDILKRRIKELNCSIEHFKGKFTSSTKYELETAYSGFDNVTDPDLIDCYIYEVNE